MVKHSEKLGKRATSLDLQSENLEPLTSKEILQINLGFPTVNLLTDQNLIDYAGNTDIRLEAPSSQFKRNKIAFTCCMLTDDKLKKNNQRRIHTERI